MGAIRGAIFLVAALGVACDVDLERADGRLELEILGVSQQADGLRVSLGVPAQGAAQSFDFAPAGATLSHTFETVPAGLTEVLVEARSGQTVLGRGQGLVEVPADGAIRLRITLAEGSEGHVTVASPRMTAALGPVTPSSGPLEVEGVVSQTDWDAFLALTSGRVEADEAVLSVVSARVELDRAASHDVEKLQDVWRLPVTVSLVQGADAVTIGTLPDAEDTTSIDATLVAADLSSIVDLESGPPRVRLSGEGRRDEEPDHRAQLRVILVLQAQND